MRPLRRLVGPSGMTRLSVIACAPDDAGVFQVSVHGELDMSNATWFTDSIIDMLEPLPGRPVRIDLADLRFLDAAGIRALLLCSRYATAHDGRLTVTDPQPIVHRVLEITRLLHMVSSPDAAERAGAPGTPNRR